MEDKIELLKKLGFSDNYLKFMVEENQISDAEHQVGHFVFETISVNTSEIVNPIIEKSEEPINSYIN